MTTVKKPSVKTAEKSSVRGVSVKKTEAKDAGVVSSPDAPKAKATMTADVFDVTGKKVSSVSLPVSLFGTEVPAVLLAQAVRVYLANQREGSASTKTRGEVEGSTRKIYRQKGTGKARHGGIRAPIFVGGGVAFGPRPHSYALGFSKSMKRKALAGALTEQLNKGNTMFVEGLDGLDGKTKSMMNALTALVSDTKKVLVIVPSSEKMVIRATRNIKDVTISRAEDLTAYTVLGHRKLIFAKSAIDVMKQTFVK